MRLGLGFGEFGPLVVTPVGDAPRASAVGDLDNDGDLDLAVLLDADTDGLALRWNDGTGHFQAPSGLIDIGEDPQQLVLGDGDGDLDLFVRRWRYPIVELELRHNLGGAVFGSPELLASAPLLGDATVVDLDGDGDLDFLVPDSGRDLVHIRSNLGAGAFGPRWSLTVPGGPHFVTVADVDGDGAKDLIVSCIQGPAQLLLATGGTFAPPNALAFTPPEGRQPIGVADLDGDGALDLAAASNFGFRYALNAGGGTFRAAQEVYVHSSGRSVAIGDLDGDGDLDLALPNWNQGEVRLVFQEAGITSHAQWRRPPVLVAGSMAQPGPPRRA